MSHKIFLFFVFITLVDTSCHFGVANKDRKECSTKIEEPVFQVNELWRIRLGDTPNVKTLIDGSYFYVVDGDLLYTTEERKFKILKIHIDEPSNIIESQEFIGEESTDF